THVGSQQLGVPQPRRRATGRVVDDDDADRDGAGQRPTAHLVHAGDQPVARGEQLALQASGRGLAGHQGSGTASKTSSGRSISDMFASGQMMTKARPTTLSTGTKPSPAESVL